MRFTCLLSILFMACGGDGNHHLTDGAVDSPALEPDAPAAGPVTVIVTLDGAAAPGVQVYFQNADSSLVTSGSALTDANGSASATMIAGGFVTVLEPQEAQPTVVRSYVRSPAVFAVDGSTLDTFAGVKPNDVIHVDVGSPNETVVVSNIELTVPTDTTTGVTQYFLFATCAQGGDGGPIDITPGGGSGSGSGAAIKKKHPAGVVANNPPVFVQLDSCTGGLADLVIVSEDNNSNPINFIYAPATNVGSASGSGSTAVTVTGTYAAVPTLTETVTDLAQDAVDVEVQIKVATSRGQLTDSEADVEPAAGSATLSFPVPTVPGGVAQTEFTVSNGSQGADIFDTQLIDDWAASPAAATSLDYQKTQIKDFTNFPTFDLATESTTWPVGTTGNAADLVEAEIEVIRSSGSGSAATQTEWLWELIGPPSYDGNATLPTLPTDVFAFNPAAGDTVSVQEVAAAIVPGGYDAVRGIIESSASLQSIISTMASGQVVVEFAVNQTETPGVAPARAHGSTSPAITRLLRALQRRHVAAR
jgi:hypothetical protein